jgi:hypothetical protein
MKTTWRDWNNAIGQATFSEEYAGRVVYMAIDAEEIKRIGQEALHLDPSLAYESFREAVIAEVGDGWPDPGLKFKASGYPRYLYALAAQVVAAFQMHDYGLASDDAYWQHLRQFLRQTSVNKMPEGLNGEKHTGLWLGMKHWANETNGGRLGRV